MGWLKQMIMWGFVLGVGLFALTHGQMVGNLIGLIIGGGLNLVSSVAHAVSNAFSNVQI
jgi:hypothetical protein